MSGIAVVIVDDQSLFRRGIRWSLEQESDLAVVGEAEDGPSAISQVDLYAPDVVLISASLRAMNGLEVTHAIRRRHPQTQIILLTARQDDEELVDAIRVGAAAYCTTDIEATELIGLIRRVARGEYLIDDNVLSRPVVASRVLAQFRQLSQADHGQAGVFSPLTPRENEILDCVAQGSSNKEIARTLNISDQTVKNHITSILRKLAVNDRTQAVIYALRNGWIELADDKAVSSRQGSDH